MTGRYYALLLVFFVAAFTVVSAQDAPVLTFSVPYQNNVKYNRFLINPAFSFVREDNTYITMYHRNQWVQYDDSPKVYMLSYNGKFTDKAGFGFGIYQQRLGVISSFGGIANYAYNVKVKDKFNVTLGFNVAYYNSGIDKNRTITEEPDPVLMAMRNNSLVSIKPGINVGYKNFDFGLYAENFVDYDFKSAGMAKLFTNKAYSGHAMYTYQVANGKDLFKDSQLRMMLRGRTSEEFGFGLSGSFLADFPSFGWIQTGIDDYYGIAIGAGFHFTKRLSLGYTFERTTKEGLVNLGPTHEITMVFSFKDRELAKKELLEEQKKPKDTLAALEEKLKEDLVKTKDSTVVAQKAEAEFDRKAELEKLKLDMDSDSQYLIDALIKEDSISKVRKDEFDQKVKNLKEYAAREKAAKEQEGENKPLELKNIKAGKRIANPKTLEELKYAEDGYYVVSKDIKAKDSDKTVAIEKHKTFTEAANASGKKRESGKEKGVYIVHVDNNPNPELEEQIEENNNKPNTLQNENPTQKQNTDTAVAALQPIATKSVESVKNDKPKDGIFSSKAPEKLAVTDKAAEDVKPSEAVNSEKPKDGIFSSKAPEKLAVADKAVEEAKQAEAVKSDKPKDGIFSSKAPEKLAVADKLVEDVKPSEAVKSEKPKDGIFSSKAPEKLAVADKSVEEAKQAEAVKSDKPKDGIFSSKAPEKLAVADKSVEEAKQAEAVKSDKPKDGIFSSKAPEKLAVVDKIAEDVKPSEAVKSDKPKEGLFSSKAPDKLPPVSFKTEEEIKDFYADRTSKPRESVKKVNRLSVEGMESGYYIIANVFSEQDRAENFVNKMAERGLRAGVFLNPKNNFSYVYLKKHSTWREALISYYSNVDNTYFDPIWIMSINAN